jgi:hypothetical protein
VLGPSVRLSSSAPRRKEALRHAGTGSLLAPLAVIATGESWRLQV